VGGEKIKFPITTIYPSNYIGYTYNLLLMCC